MTSILPTSQKLTAPLVLSVLAVVVFLVALLTPEEAGNAGRDLSSFSTGPGGAAIARELAERMGWKTEQRIQPLDSTEHRRRTHVVLAPSSALGAHEVHRLLQEVRGGGSLLVSLDGDDEAADSLGASAGLRVGLLRSAGTECPDDRIAAARAILTIPPDAREIDWHDKPPARDTVLLTFNRSRSDVPIPGAVGFPFGLGRVVIVGSSSVFSNAAVRYCRWDADLAVARMFAYLRPENDGQPTMVFDEFHHGYGVHGGSFRAAATYLGRTSSGHFLAQALVAALLLLLAKAPRPLPPRDDALPVRRSPIEHAEALGRALEDVGATRTAAARLLAGVRRRVGRGVQVPAGAPDGVFLAAAAREQPALADAVRRAQAALGEPVTSEQFALVGDALERIECALTRDAFSRQQ